MKISSGTKRPWLPFHGAEFFSKANLISDAQGMALLRLIWSYWENGGLPNDDQKLARIARMTPKQWEKSREALAEFFGEAWKSERLDFELAKIVDLSNKNREKAELQHSQRSGRALPEQMQEHDHTHLHVDRQDKSVDIVGTRAREGTDEEAFSLEVRELATNFLRASGFSDRPAPATWSDLTERVASWLQAGYSPTMIIGETRIITHKGGHTKPLSYFQTTFERVHARDYAAAVAPGFGLARATRQ
jgi:uncharacterized protein YdaU (DUF1376 family)